jgi:hypothetical protein
MKALITVVVGGALVAGGVGASAQAVREGLRRTGDAVVQGADRAVQGAGQITRRAGEAAVGTAQGAGQAVRGAAGAAAGTVRSGINRLTPAIPQQARADANLQAGNQGRDARWRFQRHNGEWWYYSPENNWMYHREGDWQPFAAESYTLPQGADPQAGNQQFADQPSDQYSGEHTTGYRGDEMATEQQGQQWQSQSPSHSQLFVDRCGRHYICENGRRVYVSIDQSAMAQGDQGYQESWSQPTPEQPTPPEDAVGQGDVQSQDAVDAYATPPANPTPPAQSSEAAAGADVPAVSDRPSLEAPASPREVNNAPDPAPEGRATTGGATDSTER